MAMYTVTNEGFVPEFGLASGAAEILQNVACIICTRLGTAPMSRDIGLSQDWRGMPINVAQTMIVSELADVISQQEPRATLQGVEAVAGDDPINGTKITAEVVIADA